MVVKYFKWKYKIPDRYGKEYSIWTVELTRLIWDYIVNNYIKLTHLVWDYIVNNYIKHMQPFILRLMIRLIIRFQYRCSLIHMSNMGTQYLDLTIKCLLNLQFVPLFTMPYLFCFKSLSAHKLLHVHGAAFLNWRDLFTCGFSDLLFNNDFCREIKTLLVSYHWL